MAVIHIHRDELYKQIWTEPTTKLASKYGISDVGLSKICKKLRIPKPPVGYWSMIRSGKKITRPSLPKLKSGESETYTLTAQNDARPKIEVCSEIQDYIEKEKNLRRRIIVSKKLTLPHPLVRQSIEILNKAKPDNYGVLRPWGKKYLNVRVSRSHLSRALRIMDALIKFSESCGFPVSTTMSVHLPVTYVEIFNEKIEFLLTEKIKRYDYVPSKEEKRKIELGRYVYLPHWTHESTGILMLQLDTYGAHGVKKKWMDTTAKKIENNLNEFVLSAIKIADIWRTERLEREERERVRKEEQWKLEEEKRRLEEEKERIRNLEKQADLWLKSRILKAYIRAVEKEASAKQHSEEEMACIEEWLSWARTHVNSIDLRNCGLPF
jgi:hypothetical protein